jgi:replicative DNA helicase
MNNVASNDHKVAMFSLEMSHTQVMQRILAQRTGMNVQDLRVARILDNQWPILTEETALVSELPFWIDDTPSISTTVLKTKARRLHMRHGLDLIIIDYLQLMRYSVGIRNRVSEITYISQQLKALARDLQVPVLALSQLNRELRHRADKHPTLHDLRGSGSLEQDADVVMGLTRMCRYDDTVPESEADLDILKARNGPIGRVQLFFHPESAFFSSAARPEEVEEPLGLPL